RGLRHGTAGSAVAGSSGVRRPPWRRRRDCRPRAHRLLVRPAQWRRGARTRLPRAGTKGSGAYGRDGEPARARTSRPRSRRRAPRPAGALAVTDLILIRHGISTWNEARRIQGRTDVPLSDAGVEQVRRWRLPDNLRTIDWYVS